MFEHINAPEKRLDQRIVRVWVISHIISSLIMIIVLSVFAYLGFLHDWPSWICWSLISLIGLVLVSMIWTTLIRPRFLYKNWRYDVSEDFLQLKSGAFFEKHYLVPMTKIQSVETSQGPLLRKYKLFTLSVETIASTHTIPGLSEEVALILREEIAHYAKVKEVE